MSLVSRRHFAVLTGAAGTATLVGLTTTSCADSSEPTSSKPSADEALVSTLTIVVRQVRELARAAGQDEIAEMHTQHLAALGDEASQSSSSPSPTSPTPTTEAPGSLLAQEQQLQVTLTAAATDAESGSLARVAASMSAAVAQRIEVLRG